MSGSHLVPFVSDLAEQLDMDAICVRLDRGAGYPPYGLALSTKLLLYGFAMGVYNSRKLAHERVEGYWHSG